MEKSCDNFRFGDVFFPVEPEPCKDCFHEKYWEPDQKPPIPFPSEEEMNKLMNDYYENNEYGDGQKDAFKNGWQRYKRRIKELNNLI